MPLPDRPVANTTIDSDWGQQVHDWTFAPKGCDLTTVTAGNAGTSVVHLHLDVATEDPAGFLVAANDEAEVPTGADGLYIVALSVNAVNGDAASKTRIFLFLNGVTYASATVDNEGGTNITINVSPGLIPLSAGDILHVGAQQIGAGTDPSCRVNFLRLLRVGNEYGA